MTYRVPARVETARLVIRRYVDADAEALTEVTARNRDHLLRYMAWARLEPQTVAQRRAFIDSVNVDFDAGTDFTMGMFARATGRFLGGTGFHVRHEPDRLEIGYWIDAAREGEGLVTEAAAALARVALEHAGAAVVSIAHAPSNARSEAVPRRLGFVRQAARVDACQDGDTQVDGIDWHATAAELGSGPLAAFPAPRVSPR